MLTLFLPVACSNKDKEMRGKIRPSPLPSPEDLEKVKDLGPIEFKGTTLKSKSGSKNNWILDAEKVEYDKANNRVEAESVKCIFFDTKGEEVMNVEARGAIVNLKSDSLEFIGTVTARSSKGENLAISKFLWDGQQKMFIGKKSIEITRNNSILRAENMTMDPDLKKIELTGNVQVEYIDNEKAIKF